jgi:hypothetical protein
MKLNDLPGGDEASETGAPTTPSAGAAAPEAATPNGAAAPAAAAPNAPAPAGEGA